MADRIGTKTICPFPFAFDPDNPLPVENLTIDDCTKTFAQVLDPLWLIFQVLLLFFFVIIFLPLTLIQLQRVFRFASIKRIPVTTTIQFKLYSVLLLFELLIISESIDIQGFRDTISPIPYFILDELAACCIVVIALLIVDFFGKTAEGSLSAKGMPNRVFLAFFILCFFCFVGLESLGITFNKVYFIFEPVKNMCSAIIAFFVYAYTRRYVRSILKFIKGTMNTANTNLQASATYRQAGSFSEKSRTEEYSQATNLNQQQSTGVVVVPNVKHYTTNQAGKEKPSCSSCLKCRVNPLDFLFDKLNLLPDFSKRSRTSHDGPLVRKNSYQIRLKFTVDPNKQQRSTTALNEQQKVSQTLMSKISTKSNKSNVSQRKKQQTNKAADAAIQLEKRYRRFAGVLFFVMALYTLNAMLLFTGGEYEWAYDVNDTFGIAGLILIKFFYCLVPWIVLHLFPVPRIAKEFYNQYNVSVSNTKTVSKSNVDNMEVPTL